MKINFWIVFVFAILLTNCSTEKVNLSPVSDNLVNNIPTTNDIGIKSQAITYQSELTNLIFTFPKFKNSAINQEISLLKTSVEAYVLASAKKNKKAKKAAYKEYTHSYKKIQKLRKYIDKDSDEVLNRYLVRIKTNVSLLESLN